MNNMANCEDLATKAELQELRDQLNAILGEREDGGAAQVFQAGLAPTSVVAQMAGSAYVGTKLKAYEAVKDIVFADPVNEPIRKEFAKGTAKWVAVKNSGSKIPLPDLSKVGKVAGTGAVAAPVVATAGATMMASMAVLSSLVSIGAGLALNIATVNVLDRRIDAEAKGAKTQIDAVNSSMLRLYDKQQGDIDAVVADLDANQQIVRQNQQGLEIVRSEVQNANRVNAEQTTKIRKANAAINEQAVIIQDLQFSVQDLESALQSSDAETQEIINSLNTQIQAIEANVLQAQEIIEGQQATIEAQNLKITEMESRIDELQSDIEKLERQYVDLRQEFQNFKEEFSNFEEEFSGEIDITNDRVTSLEGKIAKTQKFVYRSSSGGGSSAAAVGATANTQSKLLDLTSKLTGTDVQTPQITSTDIYNNTQTFDNTFQDLLNNLSDMNINQQQLDDLRENIVTGTSTNLTSLLGGLVVPRLDTIQDQTTERRMADATARGICQSLNGQSPCSATPGNPNPTQGLQGMQNALQNQANQLSALLGLGNLGLNQTMLGIVQNTNQAVRHGTYGLENIQKYAETAWKATRADKMIQALNTVLIINNGLYVSRNIFATVGDALSVGLEALGIKDSEGEELDVNNFVASKINQFAKTFLGKQTYNDISDRMKRANRIFQVSANMYDAVRSITASTREITEATGIDVARIGNALRFSGVVDHDSYGHMAEEPRKLNKLLEALEKGEDAADAFENVIGEVANVKEQSKEFNDEREEFKKLIEEERKNISKVEVPAEAGLERIPEPTDKDKAEYEPPE